MHYVSALAPGPAQQEAAAHLAQLLGAGDASAALAWAQTLPPESRGVALLNAADGWARRDGAAATRWVAQQPAEAFGALAEKALHSTLSYWFLQDRTAAAAWLESAPLSAETKARLRP